MQRQMYFPKINVKNDPVRRWHRPDRQFFANGACHVLAYAFLQRYSDLGFRARWIKPAAGFTGNHIFVTNERIVFDYHGLTAEGRLLSLVFRRARASIRTGTQQSSTSQPTSSSRSPAPGRSKDCGCASHSNSFMMPCREPLRSSIALAI
jgi:hypothetical protein